MKLFNLYVFTTLFSVVRSSFMPAKKICRDCKHFIGDSIACRKFSDTNLITGEVTYHSARSVRQDIKKCGEDATHFEKNQFKIITIPYYFLKNNLLMLLPGGLILTTAGAYLYVLFYFTHK